jgi:hypothetical protein
MRRAVGYQSYETNCIVEEGTNYDRASEHPSGYVIDEKRVAGWDVILRGILGSAALV